MSAAPARERLWTLPGRGGRDLVLGPGRPQVMGIVNLTPDSFSDGGRFADPEAAIAHALELEQGGATILDLGAESTRPGAEAIPAAQQLERLLPVLDGLRPRTAAALSIDTRSSEVARICLEHGADWINDVSALQHDPEMAPLAAAFDVPVVLMHMRGTPATMQDAPSYGDVVAEVVEELAARRAAALAAGIRPGRLLVDPGLGFGKLHEHNLELLRHLEALHVLEAPILLGASRKRFLGQALQTGETLPPPAERDVATLAAVALGQRAGVSVHRVHHARYASAFLRVLRELEGTGS